MGRSPTRRGNPRAAWSELRVEWTKLRAAWTKLRAAWTDPRAGAGAPKFSAVAVRVTRTRATAEEMEGNSPQGLHGA